MDFKKRCLKIGHVILDEHVSAIDRLTVSFFLSLDLSLSLSLSEPFQMSV